MPLHYTLAIHIGAGHHATTRESRYTDMMRNALREARVCMDERIREWERLASSSENRAELWDDSEEQSTKDASPQRHREQTQCMEQFFCPVLTHVIALLEDSPLTNAGYASNLTRYTHRTECDACVMSHGKFSRWGAIGAARGIKNPVKGAEWLMERASWHGRGNDMSNALMEPVMLSGTGLWDMIRRERGMRPNVAPPLPFPEICEDADKLDVYLVDENAQKRWEFFNEKLYDTVGGVLMVWCDDASNAEQQDTTNGQGDVSSTDSKAPLEQPTLSGTDSHALQSSMRRPRKRRRLNSDTPRQSAQLDKSTTSCSIAGVSSGGIAMKHEGRIGEAAIAGIGCFADAHTAISCTGAGEDIMLSFSARNIADQLRKDQSGQEALRKALVRDYVSRRDCLEGAFEQKNAQPRNLMGTIVLSREPRSGTMLQSRIKLSVAFTTWSMGVGHISSASDRIHASIERLDQKSVGKDMSYNEISIQ